MKYLILIAILFTTPAHAGLLDLMAGYYNSRDKCQLKNYPGGVEKADPSQLPSYCGKGTYSRQQRIDRALDSGSIYVPLGNGASGYPNSDKPRETYRNRIGNAVLIQRADGSFEYIQLP